MILCEYVGASPDLTRERSIRMLRLLYEGFNYPLDRIVVSAFKRYQPKRAQGVDGMDSRDLVHYYTPIYKGKPRHPPRCIYERFEPENWLDYVYLGHAGHPVHGLVPMILEKRNLQGMIYHKGCMFLSRDVIDEKAADLLLEEALMYRTSGYLAFPNTFGMTFSAGLLGRPVVSRPGQRYVPAVCVLGQEHPDEFYGNVERTEQQLLPLTGFTPLPLSLVNQTDIVRQRCAMVYWACAAWTKMGLPKLELGRIYDIYADATHTLRIPASTSIHPGFHKAFQEVRANMPLKLWNLIAWEDEEHLRTLRYYFENKGYVTFVPPVQVDLGGPVSRPWLLVNTDNTALPRDSDLYQKAASDLLKVRSRAKDVGTEMDLWGYYPASAYTGILPYYVDPTRLDTDLE